MKGFSFKDLKTLYKKKSVPPEALEHGKLLPGASVYEKLNKLHAARQSNDSFADYNEEQKVLLNSSDGVAKKVVAVCLVIVDKLPHEAIWRHWIESSTQEYSARLFIHAKNPDKIASPWVAAHTLPHTYSPEWNSPEVVRAMLYVLEAALQDAECQRFVLGTESCIPIHSLSHIAEELYKEDVSWLDAYNNHKSLWELGTCFRAVNPQMIPTQCVWKSIPGWVMFNRRHAAEICVLAANSQRFPIVNDPSEHDDGNLKTSSDIVTEKVSNVRGCLGQEDSDIVRAWGTSGSWKEGNDTVWAPEEMFFPTMMSILGYLRASGKDQVRRKRVTYAQWQRIGDANPVSYPSLNAELLKDFRDAGSLFGRKFAANTVTLDTWIALCSDEITKVGGGDLSANEKVKEKQDIKVNTREKNGDDNNNNNNNDNTGTHQLVRETGKKRSFNETEDAM